MLLNGTAERIENETYPLTTEDLIEKFGSHEIEHQNGSQTLAEVLDDVESETFDCPNDALFAIYAAVSGDAVGRRGYCDRDPTPPGVPRPYGPVSF